MLPFSGLWRALASERLAPVSLFALALGLGAVIRLAALGLGDGFPLNDGGMFLVMVEDLRANGYALPERTSYNGGEIPFAYPPLPFYLASVLASLGAGSTLELLRVLPLLFSILTIPAFWLLARSMLRSPLQASLATLLFVAIPRSFNWEIVGGGLTRSPGMFFATLAVWQAYELFHSGSRRHVLPAMVLSALAVLCHMEMGWFVAFSTAFFALWHRKQPGMLLHAGLLAGGVALLTLPWYGGVVLRSGIEPMLSAAQSGGHSPVVLLSPLLLRFTDDTWFPVALAFALLGLLAALRDRQYLLPVWLLLIFVLDPRKAATVGTLPLTMLASIGLTGFLWPMLRRQGEAMAPAWAFAAVSFLLVVFAPAAAVISSNGPDSPLYAMPPEQQEAMAWVRSNTDADSRFIVLPSANRWANDAPSEWFPALADRQSVNTVQGTEWLGAAVYRERQESFKALAECATSDVSCLDGWRAAGSDRDFDHIFVPKGESAAGKTFYSRQLGDCCARLLESLRSSNAYTLVFENDGAAVFERTGAAAR